MKKLLVFAVVLAAVMISCASSGGIRPKVEGPPPVDKRGVSYGFEQDKTPVEDMTLLVNGGAGIKWFYNWYVAPEATAWAAAKENKVVFYPMTWNDRWDEAVLEEFLKQNPDCEYLLGYNEPNLTDQCNMTPKQAAQSWPRLVKFAKKHNLKLVAPAMNYGTLQDYWVPWVWLNEFFGIDWYDWDNDVMVKNKGFPGVSLDDIAAIAVHSYMPDAGAVKWFLGMYKTYNKPIWLTEFCSWEFNNGQWNAEWQNSEFQMKYMSEAVIYLELDPAVGKYAWFIPKGSEDETAVPGNKLLTKGPNPKLTALGKVFVNMSTCDKSKWVPIGTRIPAALITDCHFSDYIGKWGDVVPTWSDSKETMPQRSGEPAWPRKEQGFYKKLANGDKEGSSGVHFRPGTDPSGEALDMYDFTRQKWVEYQVEASEAKTYTLSLRNTADEATQMEILVDGQSAATVNLKQGSAWNTVTVPVAIPAGQHTLRLKIIEGDCALNWLRLD